MSSSPTTPPGAPGTNAGSDDNYERAVVGVAQMMVIVGPLLILLPPRRLNLQTAFLGAATAVSFNHLHKRRFGYGVMGHFGSALRQEGTKSEESKASRVAASLPTDRAREFHEQFRLARESVLSEAERVDKERRERGVVDKVWYGEQKKEGWKEEREKEVQAMFQEGKGIGDVILAQIWEVWNWDQAGDGKGSGEEKAG